MSTGTSNSHEDVCLREESEELRRRRVEEIESARNPVTYILSLISSTSLSVNRRDLLFTSISSPFLLFAA